MSTRWNRKFNTLAELDAEIDARTEEHRRLERQRRLALASHMTELAAATDRDLARVDLMLGQLRARRSELQTPELNLTP